MTGELQESAEGTVNRQRVGGLVALHTGQSRRTVCGVFSGNDAREANPRVDNCSEACGSLLAGNERLCQQA